MNQQEPDYRADPRQHEERLGLRLREAREYLGLSQEFVAEQLGLPRPSISAIEAGKRKVSSRELAGFARLYKRPVPELLEEEEQAGPLDESVTALFRTTRELTEDDRQQVLRFAQFLRSAGRPPAPDR
jgi:transcriptional regulator with XRE-family HTH domain